MEGRRFQAQGTRESMVGWENPTWQDAEKLGSSANASPAGVRTSVSMKGFLSVLLGTVATTSSLWGVAQPLLT
jgi:hypothetical protein